MKIIPNNDKYLNLRQIYPFFTYESYQYSFKEDYFEAEFVFNLSDKYSFRPTLKFPARDFYKFKDLPEELIQNIVFHIGMVELISYWKASCSPQIIIKPHFLNEKQKNFWKNIYFNGLGEFFYLNNINVSIDDFAEIIANTGSNLSKKEIITDESVIIPIGGGKDSVVTLELLKHYKNNNIPLIMNPRGASLTTAEIGGYPRNKIIEINRTIHPQLLELNKLDFLNGHTPFSALLAFVTLLSAAFTGKRNIALSNESSANESTVENSSVNHQYSKSYDFEADFREYIDEFVTSSFNYFSFLRPLSELQIGSLFAKFPKYHADFKSCNAGSKEDIWCGKCPKCLFAYIILSPFINRSKMINIFGKDMLNDKNLLYYFEQLIGVEKVKPFECVGTVDEVNIAVNMTIRQIKEENLPVLFKYYKTLNIYMQYENMNLKPFLRKYNEVHFLNSEFENIIKQFI